MWRFELSRDGHTPSGLFYAGFREAFIGSLMEAELIEPSLYLNKAPDAARTFVNAFLNSAPSV